MISCPAAALWEGLPALMTLLLSKALLVCLLALAVRLSLGKRHDQSCVRERREEYHEQVRQTTARMVAVDHEQIIKNTRLTMDSNGEIDIDYGANSYIWHENSTEIKEQFLTSSPYLTVKWNEDTEARVETLESGDTVLYLIVRNSTLNCTVKVETGDLHGNLVLHPAFFTLTFSPDGKYLLYVAEALKDHHAPYQPNIGGTGWMERVYRPTLFLLEVETQDVRPLSTPGLAAGQSVWLEDSRRLVSVVRPLRWSPCPQCTDYSSRLLLLHTDSDHTHLLTSDTHHVSVPRVIPGHDAIVFFRNSLTVLHDNVTIPNTANAPQSLVALSLKDHAETVIIDEEMELEDVGKIYPALVNPWPDRMFLKVSLSCLILIIDIYFHPGRRSVRVQLRHFLQDVRCRLQEGRPGPVRSQGADWEGVGRAGHGAPHSPHVCGRGHQALEGETAGDHHHHNYHHHHYHRYYHHHCHHYEDNDGH